MWLLAVTTDGWGDDWLMCIQCLSIQAYLRGATGEPVSDLLADLSNMIDDNVWREIASLKREVAALRKKSRHRAAQSRGDWEEKRRNQRTGRDSVLLGGSHKLGRGANLLAHFRPDTAARFSI